MIGSILRKLSIEGDESYQRLVDALESMDVVALSMLEGRLAEPALPDQSPETSKEVAHLLAARGAWRAAELGIFRSVAVEGTRVTVETAGGWSLAFDVVPRGGVKVG